jgi:hypothetical protein
MTKSFDEKDQLETATKIMGKLASMPHKPHVKKAKKKKKAK